MKSVAAQTLAVISLFVVGGISAKADLTIDPTFGAKILDDPDAALIEASIDDAISRIESDIATNITVNITFGEASNGLGASSVAEYTDVALSTYEAALEANASTPADAAALASLQANPPPAGTTLHIAVSLATALGIYDYTGTAGTIKLNTAAMNLSRTGSQDPYDYDIEAVAAHEIDEVLGIGGAGSELGDNTSDLGVMDLFRYSAPGVRSFTTSSSAIAYFSINDGTTDLVNFNQSGSGDYGDWGNGALPAELAGNNPPQVQDAFGTPGVDVNVGPNEMTALDVVGYTLTPAGLALEADDVPEPSTYAMLLGGLAALGLLRRSRHRKPA